MKKLFVFACVFTMALCVGFAEPGTLRAKNTESDNRILFAQEVGNQDPYAPDFAPGEKADGSVVNSVTPPIATVSSTSSDPIVNDISGERNSASDGVGLLGALMFSPIVSLILYFVGFLVVVGVVVLVVVISNRHRENNQSKSVDNE